jgi:hypothetical protein
LLNDQVKDIAESGLQLAKVFASRSAINAELLKDVFRKADITFERDYDLDLGGMHAKLAVALVQGRALLLGRCRCGGCAGQDHAGHLLK